MKPHSEVHLPTQPLPTSEAVISYTTLNKCSFKTVVVGQSSLHSMVVHEDRPSTKANTLCP